MTRRRWIADTWSPPLGRPTHAALTGEQATHLARVLRAQPGQIFDVVANGFLHRAEITAVRAASGDQKPEVAFTLLEELEADSALPIHLLLAVFKFDHFEWAVEKATELGVARITPILARRTEKHLALASAKRIARWRRIALDAAQQSRRTDVPEIADPVELAAALKSESDAAPLRLLLSETEQTVTLASALVTINAGVPRSSRAFPRDEWDVKSLAEPDETRLALAIGPEGGWTPEEMALFTQHHWTHVTLGPRILRAETAAIAALAIASAVLEPGTSNLEPN
jgi:16S rRNA (uracil1498-N3)-methyltransferase